MGVKVQLRIQELVFRGVDGLRPADRDRVAEAFTRELTHLLAQRPIAAADPVPLESITPKPLPRVVSARRLGVELARTVHRGLSDSLADRGRSV